MAVTQLILEHGEQVRNDIQPLGQETNTLVHFKVASHSLVDRLQLGFNPEQFGGVKHGTVQMDVDAENKELADLHVDL